MRRAQWRELDAARCRIWQRQLRAVADARDPPEPELLAPRCRCYCGRTFINVGAYRTRHARDHRPEGLAQRYAPASLCYACGKDFDARPRLIHRVRYRGAPCAQELPALRAPLSDGAVTELRAQDAKDIAELKLQGFPAA